MQPTVGLILSFSAFLVLFLWVGALASRYSKGTEDDYLLGSRSFGRWAIGLSAGATGNTGFILIAAVGMGYTQGVTAFALWIAFFIGELIFWSLFADRLSNKTERTGAETVAELVTTNIEKQTAGSVRSLVSLLIFVFIGAYIVAQLAGSAKILTTFFGIESTLGVFISLFAILAYCTTGGLRASIWTDIVQAVVMIVMTTGVVIHALSQAGGWSQLAAGLSAIDPTLLHFSKGHTFLSLVSFMLGFVVIGALFGLSQPHVTVRVMAGRDPREVKKARWVYLGFIYGTGLSMTLFGICCRLLMPDIADPESSLPNYAIMSFPPIVVGLVLAGMFSTIASSADSQILACSSAIARDFSPKFSKRMTNIMGIRYQQLATILTGLIAAIATVFVSSSVYELVVFSLSVLSASLGAGMLITIMNRPTSATCMITSMLSGVFVALLWRYVEFHNFMSDVVPGFIAAIAVHELASRVLVKDGAVLNTTKRPLPEEQTLVVEKGDRVANC